MADLSSQPLAKTTLVPRRRRKWGRLVIALVVVAILATGGVYLWRYLNTYEATDDAQIDGHINSISGRVPGNVIAITAEDEQIVNAGDVLVKLDPKDYEVSLAKAEADLADAEAALATSRTGVPITARNTDSQLRTARSGRDDATAFLTGSQRQLAAARIGAGRSSRSGSE
jgi:membrane fusion protein (multidrug efflux system)